MTHTNPPSTNFPLNREQIPVETFKKLWEELQRVLREEHQLVYDPKSRTAARFFGMGDFAPNSKSESKSVATLIAGIEQINEILPEDTKKAKNVNFGDYLSKRVRDLASQPKPEFITFGKRAYVYGYFLFLGFQNKEAFEAHHGLNLKKNPALRDHSPEIQNAPSVYYLGSFFSVRSYTIKHFIIGINYQSPIKDNTFFAEEWGFHRLDEAQDQQTSNGHPETRQYSLSGTALIRNNRLYLNLTTPETEQNWTQMNIMGWGYGVSSDHIKVQRIIRCNVQTISVLGYPVAAEAVLVRLEEQKWQKLELKKNQVPSAKITRKLLGSTETDALMLYLMLQRRNFWIKNEFVDSLLDLQVRGNLVQNYRFLKGTWRVWNYGLKPGQVVQSKLIINKQFAATFCPFLKSRILDGNERLRNQAATLSISRGIQPNKLFFHTYLRPNLAIINTAVFDLETIGKLGFAEGMFLSGGYDAQGIIGGYCVMKKLNPGEADFEPMEFDRDQALAYEKDHKLDGFYEGLRKLWKRKTWARRRAEKTAPANQPDDTKNE